MRARFHSTAVSMTPWLLTGCVTSTPTPTPTPTATLDAADALATLRGEIILTQRAEATIVALTPTATRGPTATRTATSIPVFDFNVTLPYLHDGGAVPECALTRIGIGWVYEAEFFPDQRRIMLGTGTGLYVYEVPTFERVWRRYLSRSPWSVDLANTGQRIVTQYGWDSEPILFDANDGRRITTLDGWQEANWSPDSQYIAVEDRPEIFDFDETVTVGRIWLYDSVSGQRLLAIDAPINGFFGGVFSVVRWSPNGQLLAACGDEALFVWETQSGRLIHTIDATSTTGGLYLRFCGLKFSPDNRYLAAQDANTLFVVDMLSGETVFSSREGSESFFWAGNYLYLIGPGVRALDSASWSEVFRREINLQDLALSSSRQRLALLADQNIVVMDPSTFEEMLSFPADADGIFWSPGDMWLVGYQYVGEDNERETYTIFDSSTGQQALPVLEAVDG